MKLLTAALLFLVACAAIAQPEPAGLRREMERFYDRWDRAIENGSMRSLLNMLEPDFYQTDQQGRRITIGGFEDMMSDVIKSGDVSSNTTVMHVRQSSNEAIVWMKNILTWGPNNLVKTRRIAHTLRKTPDGWKVYYSQILPDNETWGPPPSKR
jgi:ketosteroid isomerase-like protein